MHSYYFHFISQHIMMRLFNAQPHLTIAILFFAAHRFYSHNTTPHHIYRSQGYAAYNSCYSLIIAYGTAFSGGKTNHDNKSYDFIILYLQAFHQPAHERWTKSWKHENHAKIDDLIRDLQWGKLNPYPWSGKNKNRIFSRPGLNNRKTNITWHLITKIRKSKTNHYIRMHVYLIYDSLIPLIGGVKNRIEGWNHNIFRLIVYIIIYTHDPLGS